MVFDFLSTNRDTGYSLLLDHIFCFVLIKICGSMKVGKNVSHTVFSS